MAPNPSMARTLSGRWPTSMQITVSPARFTDWPQLLGLVRESFAYMDSRIDPPSSLKKMGMEEFKAKAVEETLILAEEANTLVGCAFAALRDDCVLAPIQI